MAKRSKRKSAAAPSPASVNGAEPLRLPAWLAATVIVVAVFWIYAPAFHGDWLWDDDVYISNQPLLHNAAGLWKIWFQPGSWSEYYPLEETVLWIEWHLFGNDTLGYHLLTTALHAVSALLVWRLLARLGLRQAWLGGLLFAVHPLQVESVAWISELKNTLSLPPFLLAMGAWLDFDQRGRRRDYALALGLFLAAMLCKSTMAMFPLVLLLHAWFRRGQVTSRDAARSAPFFAISLALGLATLWAQHHHGDGGSLAAAPAGFLTRLVLAGLVIWFAIAKFVWPAGLAPTYPIWDFNAASPLYYVPWLALVAWLSWCWWKRAAWGRGALLASGFFLLNLVPPLAFLMAEYRDAVWSLDHLFYLPMIGLIGLAAAAIELIEVRLPGSSRIGVTAAVTLLVGLLAVGAHAYAGDFTDETTLWSYAVQRNPGNWEARDNLAKALLLDQRPEEAAEQFRAALLLRPARAQIHLNYGRALVALNRTKEGLAEYDTALALDPSDPEIYNQKGVALLQAGRNAEAIAPLEKAVDLRPRYAIGLENLGIALALSGRLNEAVDRFNASIQIEPGDPTVHVNLGRALRQLGRNDDAAAQLHLALQLDPANAAAKAELAKPAPGTSGTAP